MHEYRIGNIIQFSEINEVGRIRKTPYNLLETNEAPTIRKAPYDPAVRMARISGIYTQQLEVLDEEGYQFMLKEAQPVELTYDILLDCGFIETAEYYHKAIPGTTGLLVYATVTKNNPIGLFLGKDPFSEKDALQLLFHRQTALHNLMNVYFAMTGDELVCERFKKTVEELEGLRQSRIVKKKLLE